MPTTTETNSSTSHPRAYAANPFELVLSRLEGVKRHGDGHGQAEARCPAHEDKHASLSVGTGDDGRVLLHCHVGCELENIIAALKLRRSDLFPAKPGTKPRIVATYEYRDAAGVPLFQVVRFEPKDFRQRRPNGKGGWTWKRGDRLVLYRLPEVLTAVGAGETIWLCEGEKDADSLVKLGLVATCNAMGAGKWRPDYTTSLRGASRVVVIADRDARGRKHGADVAQSLTAAGIDARLVEVTKGKDSSDWIAAGARREDFEALAEAPPTRQRQVDVEDAFYDGEAPEPPTHQDLEEGRKPRIELGVDEDRVVREAMTAISTDPNIYQRGADLVRVLTAAEHTKVRLIVREPGAPWIEIVPEPWVRTKLAGAADWVRYDENKGKWVQAHPPPWAISSVATAGTWPGMRPLLAVIETPILRADGSVLDRPGYDESTGLLFKPLVSMLQIPAHPTLAEAISARERLLDVVRDFPFERAEHRAAWLSLVLTFFCRWAFDGPTPLFLLDANTRGAGKSLLARASALLATGRVPPTMTLPAADEEQRKRITALALAGDSMVLVDNVEGVLGGPTLNAVLTSTTWNDRILGLSRSTGTLPLYLTWIATANNATLGPDTARRTIHIRLASPLERPEERRGFAHPDILSWIRAERGWFLADALTICRGYFEAGRPDMDLPSMGSFEGWSLVRQIVVWVGLPDPLLTQVSLAETSDREAAELRGLIGGLETASADLGRPVTLKELLQFAERPEGSELRQVLMEYLPGAKSELPNAIRLSGRLRHFKGRVSGGRVIDSEPGHGGVDRWLVRRCPNGGVGGFGGVPPANARAHASARESEPGVTNQPNQPNQPPDEDAELSSDDNSDRHAKNVAGV